MRTSGSEGGRRKPTRENAGRAPPADPTPTCRPGTGLLLHRLRHGPVRTGHIVGRATNARTGHQQRGWRPRADDPGAQAPRGRRPPGARHHHGGQYLSIALHRTTRRRGHRGLGRRHGILLRRRRRPGPGQAPANAGPVQRDGPRGTATTPGTATARWVNRHNRTRPHRANPDDLSPAAAEHRYHRNHTTTAAPATA